VPASLWTLWAWLMVALGGVSIGAGIVGGILAPSVILDVVSFWPLVLVPVVVGLVLWRRQSSRVGAIPPLLLITILTLAVVLHLVGWSRLPSAAADLSGPSSQGVSTVALTITLPGRLAVHAGQEPLYTVRLDREGGSLGVPEALEQRAGEGALAVDVHQRDGGRWFRTDGWVVELAEGPAWDLDLSSPGLQADLRSLRVDSLTVDGVGDVLVAAAPADITISGTITVAVVSGAVVEVHGPATVPAGWQVTDDGFRSSGDGPVVRISVTDGADVVIKEL
jgi:hypothetical protein